MTLGDDAQFADTERGLIKKSMDAPGFETDEKNMELQFKGGFKEETYENGASLTQQDLENDQDRCWPCKLKST